MTSSQASSLLPGSVRPRAILVLGMHRSGTSALTRTLNLLGADLPAQIMGSLPGVNEPGFWEPKDLVTIHDEMLSSGGSSWDDISRFPEAWFRSDAARRYRERILEVLRQDFAESALFVLKDPRLCRWVPFWLSVLEEFGADPAFVIPVRNPLEVAASLKIRDGFEPVRSHLLWLRHVLDAEYDTRAWPRSFISFDDLMKDWRRVTSRLRDDLEISELVAAPEAATEIDSFLCADHHHHHFSVGAIDDDDEVPEVVKKAFSSLTAAAAGDARQLPGVLDAIRAEFDTADRIIGPLVKADRLRIQALREGGTTGPEALVPGDGMDAGVVGLYQRIERLSGELTTSYGTSAALGEELERVQEMIGTQGNELIAAYEKLTDLGGQLEAGHQRWVRLGEELAVARQESAHLGGQLETKRLELETKQLDLAAAGEAFSALQAHASRLERKIGMIRRIPLAGAVWAVLQRARGFYRMFRNEPGS